MYPITLCVQVCREHSVTDAEAYLLERTGDISGALDLILRSTEKALEQLKVKLRTLSTAALISKGIVALAASGSGGLSGGLSGGQGGGLSGRPQAASANARAVFRSLPEGEAVARHLRVAIEVCERSTARAAAEPSADPSAESSGSAHSAAAASGDDRLAGGGRSGPTHPTSRHATASAAEQRLWNYLLDRLLLAKATLKLGGEAAPHRLVLESVLTEV